MLKQTLIATTMIASTMSFAGTHKLTADSSWDEILNHTNIDVRGDGIRVGNTNTTVFFVEQEGHLLHTKKPTTDGFYKDIRGGNRDSSGREFVKTGESIKTGEIIIHTPVYEFKRINRDRESRELVGYKHYVQPTTRMIDVYEVKEVGSNDNRSERFLFSKEYVIPKKSS